MVNLELFLQLPPIIQAVIFKQASLKARVHLLSELARRAEVA